LSQKVIAGQTRAVGNGEGSSNSFTAGIRAGQRAIRCIAQGQRLTGDQTIQYCCSRERVNCGAVVGAVCTRQAGHRKERRSDCYIRQRWLSQKVITGQTRAVGKGDVGGDCFAACIRAGQRTIRRIGQGQRLTGDQAMQYCRPREGVNRGAVVGAFCSRQAGYCQKRRRDGDIRQRWLNQIIIAGQTRAVGNGEGSRNSFTASIRAGQRTIRRLAQGERLTGDQTIQYGCPREGVNRGAVVNAVCS